MNGEKDEKWIEKERKEKRQESYLSNTESSFTE